MFRSCRRQVFRIATAQVAAANAYQVEGAGEYAYPRPGSGLEQFVRSLAQ